MKKAQTSIVMILMVIVIFGGLAIFLLSLAGTITQEDYMNMYAHNMLLTLLRTDTGEGGDCKYVSDVATCAVYGMSCDSGTRCYNIAEDNIEYYMEQLSRIKATYNWFIAIYNSEGIELLSFGDQELINKKTKKWTASEIVYKRLGSTDQSFSIRLILARKD